MLVNVGETFDIPLEANLTAGFRWEPVLPEETSRLVDFLGEQFEPDASHVGAPGIQHLRFKALQRGEVNIIMRYSRPWENSRAKEEKVITISVV